MKHRPRRRWPIVVAVIVVIVAWGALVAFSVMDARRHADRGIELLHEARSGRGPSQLIRGEGLHQIEQAHHEFAVAHDKTSAWWVAPTHILPFLGRQVRSVDALTASAERVVGVGAKAMRESRSRLDTKLVDGPTRIQTVAAVGAIADSSNQQLRSVNLGPSNALIGPLQQARDKFGTELHDLRKALGDVGAASTGIKQLLDGPSRYLVFAANNGEMRAGSGMFLSVGELTFDRGRFTLGDMADTGDLTLPIGAVPVTGDLAARWGWTNPSSEWRNLMMSPRLPASAALAAQMWQYRTGTAVDGVLVLDPVALQALLRAEGPVDVNGQRIDADNVVHDLLYDQYVGNADDNRAQAARRDQLGAIARAAVENLDRGGWDAPKLLDELRKAGDGRHILAWSNRPDQEKAWTAAGIAGDLQSDSVLAASNSTSGNKLDQFVQITGDISVTRGPRLDDVALRVDLQNVTPQDAPAYVAGAFPGAGLQDGEYRGIVAVDVPGAARNIRIVRGAPPAPVPLVAAGPDGAARVVATELQVPRGTDRQLVVQFQVPAGLRRLRVEPSARVPGVHWRFGHDQWWDDAAHTVAW